jgi:hypothetical protein
MNPNPYKSPHSSSERSLAEPVLGSNRDWFLIASRCCYLLALSVVLVFMSQIWWDPQGKYGLIGFPQFHLFVGIVICLALVSGVLLSISKLKLKAEE